MRFRSSSRCSRNDIFASPPASSSSRSPSAPGSRRRMRFPAVRKSGSGSRSCGGPASDPGNGTRAMGALRGVRAGARRSGRRRGRAAHGCRVDRWRRGRGRRRRGGGRGAVVLLLDADFLLERASQLVGRLLEFVDAAPQATGRVPVACAGPKIMSAITRMMMSSGMPMEPNI